MLNRFKNVLYGSSGSNDDSSVIDYEYRESVIGERVRSALTRSSSFREDLLNGGLRNRLATSGDRTRGSLTGNKANDSTYDTSQYSQHSSRRNIKGNIYSTNNQNNVAKQMKYPYQRPEFLQLKTEDEILVSADHQIRPIILPRDVSRLPWRSGYAECINAGKSLRNEDQATCYQGVAVPQIETEEDEILNQLPVPIYRCIPWTYFAVFDGHAGSAVAIAAANQLHHILAEKLNMVAKKLIEAEFRTEDMKVRSEVRRKADVLAKENASKKNKPDTCDTMNDTGPGLTDIINETDQANTCEINPINNTSKCDKVELSKENESVSVNMTSSTKCDGDDDDNDYDDDDDEDLADRDSIIECFDLEPDVSVDSLISGALESAFWEMDLQIGADKRQHKMPGGCTAIAALFILGKLYVCNAGDSRAITVRKDGANLMSHDYTPVSERKRLTRLGFQFPELLCGFFTQIEYYPRHPNKSHLGTKMLYRDAYMTGFAMKTITEDDLKYPLVCGEGKRSRLLATIGVTRGFGDHEMRSQYGSVPIKPFLTPEPGLMQMDIEKEKFYEFNADDVLIIGTDGLWDVTSLDEARETVESSFEMFPECEESRSKYRYMTAAQDLIIQARGQSRGYSVWTFPTPTLSYASHDDITVFVIPLKPYKQEYEEWKQARFEALAKALNIKTGY